MPRRTKVVDDANSAIAEINALKMKVNALVAEFNAREVAMGGKDLLKDRAEINKIAQEEANLLKEAAGISRSIADQAAQVKTGKLEKKYRHYFELIAQHNLKYAEMLDVMREQAEALLGNESGEAINARRAETQKRIEALRQEADRIASAGRKADSLSTTGFVVSTISTHVLDTSRGQPAAGITSAWND